MARMKVILRESRRRVTQQGTPLGSTPPSPAELVRREGLLKGGRWWGGHWGPHPHYSWSGWQWRLYHQCWGDGLGQAYCIWKGPLQRFLEEWAEEAPEVLAGIVALCEICQYQRSTKLLIHKWPFAHLMCKIVQDHRVHDMCFQVHVINALQEAAEYYLTCLFDDANLCFIHTKCVTIMPWGIHLECHIHREQKMQSLFLSVVVGIGWVTGTWGRGIVV